jgi:hypothetical protein
MPHLLVSSILGNRVLVRRESARLLDQALREHLGALPPSEPFVLDFQGINGVAPSFLDELLLTIESALRAHDDRRPELVVANPPTRLSLKFEAIGRSHGMSVRARGDGSWALTANTC